MSRNILTVDDARSLFSRSEGRIFDVLEFMARSPRRKFTSNEIRKFIGYQPKSDHLRIILERMASVGVLTRSTEWPRRYSLSGSVLSINLRRGPPP